MTDIICLKCFKPMKHRHIVPDDVDIGYSFGRCQQCKGLLWSVPSGCVVILEER